jgi:hypothetical protein
MKFTLRWIALVSIIIASGQDINAQSQAGHSGEQHQKSERHHDGVNRRGDREMGFSHAKTTHHFRLKSDGGIIEVTANSTNDTASRDQIRQHLKHIAKKFSEGDFSAPMFIHGQVPPGVEAMKRLKAEIKYQYGEIERGAHIRISTGNTEAIKAIHEFLRFQIHDHQTGDTTEIEKRPVN